MKQDKRYTLLAARLELARRTCAREGHDYQVVVLFGLNHPHRVICRRCPSSWRVPVEPEER